MKSLLKVLPKNYLSYGVGKLVHMRLPAPLNQQVIKWFVRRYKIDLSDIEGDIKSYKSLGEFFIRNLKKSARPIGEGIVHPCDSVISEVGVVQEQTLVQAKGLSYNLAEFLLDSKLAADLEGGIYITYYLCPADYHRVHSPVDGEIEWCSHVPGQLWPVNQWSVQNIQNLFPRNERLIANVRVGSSNCALVMVGATNVGKMSVAFDQQIVTNNLSSRVVKKDYSPAIKIKKGDLFGTFHMGSTVVMIYPKDFLGKSWKEITKGSVKFGASL